MVTLEVRFRCDVCKMELMHEIRVGANFFLGADQVPEGWKLSVAENSLKVWCPLHSSLAK
jgi:hypothetical protein